MGFNKYLKQTSVHLELQISNHLLQLWIFAERFTTTILDKLGPMKFL